jgi:hypothetical protein
MPTKTLDGPSLLRCASTTKTPPSLTWLTLWCSWAVKCLQVQLCASQENETKYAYRTLALMTVCQLITFLKSTQGEMS